MFGYRLVIGKSCLATWFVDGSCYVDGLNVVSEGWPLELVDGGWYRDQYGEAWFLHVTPKFYGNYFAGYTEAPGMALKFNPDGNDVKLVEPEETT